MTDVKRNDIEEGFRSLEIRRCEDGEFVRADDHYRIVSKLRRLLSAKGFFEELKSLQREHARVLDLLRRIREERDTLRAEVEDFRKEIQELRDERAALADKNQRLRKDAVLEKAVQRAAGNLPAGWEIRLYVERDSGTVELNDPDGNTVEYPSDHECLATSMLDAIDAALEASR